MSESFESARTSERESQTDALFYEAVALRRRVEASLREQGLQLTEGGLLATPPRDKQQIRKLHEQARHAAIERAKGGLQRHESRLLRYFARGEEVEPEHVRPRLVQIEAETEEELLFRYARLHWSIPVSAGYGRRLRFLVFDEHTEKLIGVFGLGDPVFHLGPRDSWIGWSGRAHRERLRHVMDAFVLGAVPPYSYLLCGKLVAMLATSREVRAAFARRYGEKTSLITRRTFSGELALITTISALGRSSLYNRVRAAGRRVFISVGTTSGSGEFHFSNGVYEDLLRYARQHCTPSAKNERWGNGWRSRRELVRAVLPRIGLSRELVYHGVKREVFVAPLARNTCEFLRGETDELDSHPESATDLFAEFRERWLLPRAARDQRYRGFDPESLRLWGG